MKRNIMLLLCGAALTASAQTDVTADYLTHYDFDSGFHHKAGATTEVKQEIKTITRWTAGFTVDYIRGKYLANRYLPRYFFVHFAHKIGSP